jgi:hypothetical protein
MTSFMVEPAFAKLEKTCSRHDNVLIGANLFNSKNFLVGYFHRYFGIEYFAKHGLSSNSSSEEIEKWMKENNIPLAPHFDDEIVGVENKACLQEGIGEIDENKLALHKQLYDYAVSRGYKFEINSIHISPSGTDLQYLLCCVSK